METTLPALVALLVGCLALAFYMDWLRLFVSDAEMRAERERAKERMQAATTHHAGGTAFAFDVDAASLDRIREALPGWKFELVNGATAASLPRDWTPRAAGLLVVGLRGNVAESLGLCRFLAFCNSEAGDFRTKTAGPREPPQGGHDEKRREGALLLVLTPAGQEAILEGALDAVTHRRLSLPIQARDVARLLAHPHGADHQGHRSGGPIGARKEDLWRDDGGQG